MKIYTIPVGSFQTNCYVVASQAGNAIIIDPGSQGERIIKGVRIMGLEPKAILLTHGHHDHIGAIGEVLEEFPGLPVLIGTGEEEMLRDKEKNLSTIRYQDTAAFDNLKEDRTLGDGEELRLDELRFSVISTPGHTSGGVTYRCEDSLFTGDTLFRQSVGRTDLPGGDQETLFASIRRLYALEGEFNVLPGHGDATTLDHERQNNPYVRG